MSELQIEYIPIEELKPYANNAKIHTGEQVDQIKKSIEEFGFNDPIAVWKDNEIIEGHGRLLAGIELGMETLPIIRLDELTDDQRRAYMLVHNQLTMNTGFDMDTLNLELDNIEIDMEQFGFEISLDDEEVEVVQDETPDHVEPRCKRGDLWKLGDHRLICGDSTDVKVIDRLMDGAKADMVFTDPPYNVSIGTIKHHKFKQREILNDSMSTDDFIVFCNKFIQNIKSNTKGCVYICGGQGEDGRAMFTCADKLLHCSTTIIWNKDQFTLGRGKYQNRYEPIWFGWVESGADFTDDRTLENVWDIPRPKKSELHPTMKPIEIMARAIRHNPKSKTVLDCFGGSGSTLIACEQLNRKCYMCELDEHYCDVILQRWENLTGEKAVLLNGERAELTAE